MSLGRPGGVVIDRAGATILLVPRMTGNNILRSTLTRLDPVFRKIRGKRESREIVFKEPVGARHFDRLRA
jgi:hypothetical protein